MCHKDSSNLHISLHISTGNYSFSYSLRKSFHHMYYLLVHCCHILNAKRNFMFKFYRQIFRKIIVYLPSNDTNPHILYTAAYHPRHLPDQDMVSHRYSKPHRNSDCIYSQYW